MTSSKDGVHLLLLFMVGLWRGERARYEGAHGLNLDVRRACLEAWRGARAGRERVRAVCTWWCEGCVKRSRLGTVVGWKVLGRGE